jgi:hypothetical protein
MASSLFKDVQKLARAEGQVINARSLCVDFVRQHRPGILSLVSVGHSRGGQRPVAEAPRVGAGLD